METHETIPTIRVRGLAKDYWRGPNVVHALRGVSLDVQPGEFVAVMGTSGSGKSTFMNLIGCLDRPTGGVYELDGVDVAGLGKDDLAVVRNRKIGFVFQGFNLLPRLTARDNVMLPMLYAGVPRDVMEHRADAALRAVGLGQRGDHKPVEMSGGQQQRAAIARSLVNGPSILLADEPTGNLDSRTSVEVMAIFQELNTHGITIVLVTHEPDIAEFCSRVVRFRDGRLIEDRYNAQPRRASQVLAEMPPPDDEAHQAGTATERLEVSA
jgi:putative ABC transport system ATP-binding protein